MEMRKKTAETHSKVTFYRDELQAAQPGITRYTNTFNVYNAHKQMV